MGALDDVMKNTPIKGVRRDRGGRRALDGERTLLEISPKVGKV